MSEAIKLNEKYNYITSKVDNGKSKIQYLNTKLSTAINKKATNNGNIDNHLSTITE